MTAPTSDDRARLLVLVLGEDLREVAGWLSHYEQLRATAKTPGAVRQPQASAKLNRYVHILTAAFRDDQADQRRAAAMRAPEPCPIGAIAHLPSQSEPQETITVVEAADLLGCSQQHVRRLATAKGDSFGYKSERNVWHLYRHSVIAYRDRPRGQRDGDGDPTGPSARSTGDRTAT